MENMQATRRGAIWLALLFVAVGSLAPPAASAQEPAKGEAVIDFRDPKKLFQGMSYLAYPLALCSLVSATIVLERFIRLRRRRVIPKAFLRRFLTLLKGNLQRDEALMICRSDGSPVAMLILAAVRHWGRSSLDIERAVAETGAQQVALLKRNLRALQGSANLATLLGLLGTVIGMIQAFNQVAASREAIGQAEVLATGIAQALLTTAAGLSVAIPSLFFYNYFSGKIERIVYEMDQIVYDVIDAISLESNAPNAPRKRSSRVTSKYVS